MEPMNPIKGVWTAKDAIDWVLDNRGKIEIIDGKEILDNCDVILMQVGRKTAQATILRRDLRDLAIISCAKALYGMVKDDSGRGQ